MDQFANTPRDITPGARVAPPASWVEIAPYAIPETANPHFISSGVCVLLDDSQIDLCGPERAWFYRRAELVTAQAGAERAAQFSVSFDPAFEKLDVHRISVIRGAERIEHAHTAFFEVLRRERHMERLQFDGRLTVHVTLPDVRPGDVVETSYTTYGMRRSLGGRHSTWIGFEWSSGIIEVRVRQRCPAGKKIAERGFCEAPEGTQTEAEGVIDRRWTTKERPGVRYESLAPPWVLQNAALQLSEWRDWAEVVEAFAPLYEDAGALGEDVEAEIARIDATYTSPAERAAAVLRFTQGAVRYLAISMGEGGYTPRKLADVEETRYGDCKDKSKLYVHMARRLGLDACPALVNTRDGYVLDTWLPSAQVFDHCIVRLAIGKKVYWLDPTRMVQPSPLDAMSQSYFGWALPLKAGVTALERMADPPVEHIAEAHERVVLGDSPTVPVRYEWCHTFRGPRAESIRELLARDGEVGVFKSYAEDVQRIWADARVVKQEVVSDDVAANTIVVAEAYDIATAWKNVREHIYEFSTLDLTLNRIFAKLDAGDRAHPIYLGQPGRMTRRVEIETIAGLNANGWAKSFDGTTLTFKNDLKKTGAKTFVLDQALEIKELTLPGGEAEMYRRIQTELSGNEVTISESASGGKFVGDLQEAEQMNPVMFWVAVALAGLVLTLILRYASSGGPA